MRLPWTLTILAALLLVSACDDDEPTETITDTSQTADSGDDGAADTASDGTTTDTSSDGSADSGDVTGSSVTLNGAVEKGPFVIGSSVSVSPVNAFGSPTGDVFNTQTTSDAGEFRLTFGYLGQLSLEAVGFYYNEVSGRLSSASLTLRAFHEISEGGEQPAFINLMTHLTYERIRVLLNAETPPETFGDAVGQAEAELLAAVGLGGDAPTGAGITMNILGGDDANSRFLFALSALAAEVARVEAGADGSVEAELQEFLNTLALDLSDDGLLTQPRRDLLDAAQLSMSPNRVMDLLQERLTDIGSEAAVPDLNLVIDSDGDGVVNASDNCPLVANSEQEEVAGLCQVEIRTVFRSESGLFITLVDDFDGDGYVDVLAGNESGATRYPGRSDGGFDDGVEVTISSTSRRLPLVADYNDDGRLDLFQAAEEGNNILVLVQGEDGNFASGMSIYPEISPLTEVGNCNFDGLINFMMGQWDAEEEGEVVRLEAVLEMGGCLIAYLPSNSDGKLGNPVSLLEQGDVGSVGNVVTADLNGDAWLDLIVQDSSDGDDFAVPLIADGEGGFTAGTPVNEGVNGGAQAIVGDFNGDGDNDLLILQSVDSGDRDAIDYSIALGDGLGGFGTLTAVVLPGGVASVLDMDGDGLDDLAIVSNETSEIAIRLSNGTTFDSVPAIDPGREGMQPLGATPAILGTNTPCLIVSFVDDGVVGVASICFP